MNYIKFDTITSTNDFIKRYGKITILPDFFYITTDYQTKGRGQRVNIWQSECCKNILISFWLRPTIAIQNQHLLSAITALSIVKVLQKFNIPDVKIKLPNDILSGNKKIAGILIENSIKKNTWQNSVIGIGLNVNQTNFEHLPDATSMKKITKQDYNRQEIIYLLQNELKNYYIKPSHKIMREFERLIKQPK